MQHFKRSTARDFRIDAKAVSDILEEEKDSEGDEEENGEGETSDGVPKAKRFKKSS